MSRITLLEFVESEEKEFSVNDIPEEQRIEITDDATADLVAETANQGVEASMEMLSEYSVAIEHLESMLVAVATARSKEKFSQEDFSEMKQKITLAVEAMGGSVVTYFPALESVTDFNVALESAEDQVQSIGTRFMTAISKIMANLRDNLTYLIQFTDYQDKRLAEIRTLVQNAPDGKFSITVPSTLYTTYDNGKQVTSFQEYSSKLAEAVKMINTLTKEIGQFTKNDLFASIKNVVMMFGKETFLKNYKNYSDTMNAVLKGGEFKNVSSTGDELQEFKTKYLLGNFRVTIHTSKGVVSDPDMKRLKKLKSQIDQMDIRVTHPLGATSSGQVEFKDIDKKSVLKVLDQIESVISGYKSFYSLAMKLSHFGAVGVMKDIFKAFAYGSVNQLLVFSAMIYFISNFKLIYKTSNTILLTTGTVFNIAKGTTKNALNIAYRFTTIAK